MVLGIQPKFWVWGTVTQPLSHKLNGGGWARASKVADLGFNICQNWPKNALLGGSLCAQHVLQGGHLHWNEAICIGMRPFALERGHLHWNGPS